MNDSEIALLALVAERKAATGYRLAALARARGMERWAGLSASSVYKGLRRLEEEGLVKAGAGHQKGTKGPPGRVHEVTPAGARALRRHLSDGLLAAPERSVRYRLALAFIEVVGRTRALGQLRRRASDLEGRIADVERARAGGGDALPLGAALVFEYVLHGLRAERAVTGRLSALLQARGRP